MHNEFTAVFERDGDWFIALLDIQRTPHPKATPLQPVHVDHRRRDVGMPEQLLPGPNVITLRAWCGTV